MPCLLRIYSQPSSFLYKELRGAMSCQPRTLNQAVSFTRCYGAPCLVIHVLSTKQFPLQGVTGRRVLSTTYSQPSSFLYKVLRGAVSCQPRTLNQVVSFTRSYGAPCLINHVLSTKQFPLQEKVPSLIDYILSTKQFPLQDVIDKSVLSTRDRA